MTNEEIIERLSRLLNEVYNEDRDGYEDDIALQLAIKALQKDMCLTCKHYDPNYGETCLNPSGTCRVFEYDGYEPRGE